MLLFLHCNTMLRQGSHLFIPFILILLSVTPSIHPMSFDLSTSAFRTGVCGRGENVICLQGNASYVDGMIRFTKKAPMNVGWAYYSEPLHLWDNSTKELTSFTTHFKIEILPFQNNTRIASGAAFFLSPYPFQIPPNAAGRCLGLTSLGKEVNLSKNLVAVEFDTYGSSGFPDPPYPHVGIDINSILSVKYEHFYPSDSYTVGNATVSYDASTGKFNVLFFDAINHSQVISISHVIDLRTVLPEWVVVGFSASTGKGDNIEFHRLRSWEFNSTLDDFLQEKQKNSTAVGDKVATAQNGTSVGEVGKKSRFGLIVGTAHAIGFIVVLVSIVSLWLWKRRSMQKATSEDAPPESADYDAHRHHLIDETIENGYGPRRFHYDELAAATSSFSETQKLGVGGFGSVYRGYLRDLNLDVAIKRCSKDSKQGVKEYISEVNIISKLQHKNLVRLFGWCHEEANLLLVYEFMSNGSLDYHLFGNKKTLLPWNVRYNIALDLASAMRYLHSEWEQCVIHRDVKSSNIMLDSNFNAKLGDFGIARLIDHGSSMQTTLVAGTRGYMAPECVVTGKGSKESDVYSFGIVLLELACGRSPIEPMEEDGKGELVNWVRGLYKTGQVIEAADPRLEGAFDKDQMERLLIMGLQCANIDVRVRPSMNQAIAALKFGVCPVPNLPQQMSMFAYSFAAPTSTATTETDLSFTNSSISYASASQSSGCATSHGSKLSPRTEY